MTTTTANPRTALLNLLARTSFRLGNFTLSSGAKSDYYIDCRTTTLHAEGGRLTRLAILDLLAEHNLHPTAVGGLTMGADPVVSAVSIASAWRAQQQPEAPLITVPVRKPKKRTAPAAASKASSSRTPPSSSSTTSAPPCSTITAIEAAREAGMKVIAAVCLVEREEAQGRAALEAALRAGLPDKQGSPFLSLYTANDVRAAHIRQLPQA